MPFQHNGWSKARSELLMDISATLADLSRRLDTCAQIPAYLCQTLGIDPITLAIISESAGKLEIVSNCSSSTPNATPSADLLSIYEQTRPLAAEAGPTLRPMIEIDRTSAPGDHSIPNSRATVFSHAIGNGYRMLLIVNQTPNQPHLIAGVAEVLQIVAHHLAKMLGCLMIWNSQPESLGAPFNKLTDREWNVLRSLDTEAGEKQLADQMGLSPHTLHSHIKSIYRKVGVQGRLPLLLRIESSRQTLRTERLNARTQTRMSSDVTEPAIAVG